MATMMELLQIDKSVLESCVIAATTKNNDVFEMLTPFLEEAAENIVENVLGEVGQNSLTDYTFILKYAQRVVCRKAFAENIASLDVVLTSTGFGVVSTQDTAPASKARVEALQRQVERQELVSLGQLIEMLVKSEIGWGETDQAKLNIPNFFWDFRMLERYTSAAIATKEFWQQCQQSINVGDTKLRRLVGNEEVEDLLQKVRNNSLTLSQEHVIDMMLRFIGFIIDEVNLGNLHEYRSQEKRIVEYMEDKIESGDFDAYKNSKTYKARHFQDYENTKDSPLFIFNG